MTSKPGRNDLCLCGSGKKFKKCCMNKSEISEQDIKSGGGYRFEPGTYGDIGDFMPSIACLKQNSTGEWIYHFVLVKLEDKYEVESEAEKQSVSDLSGAFETKNKTGSEEMFAAELKEKGYINVDDFNIVQTNSNSS